MAKPLLAISGHVEDGETLSALVWNTGTKSTALTCFTLPWQVLNGGAGSNTGSANTHLFGVPSGNSALTRCYPLEATPTGPNDEAATGIATHQVSADRGNQRPPSLAAEGATRTIQEHAAPTQQVATVKPAKADNSDDDGGTLTVSTSNDAPPHAGERGFLPARFVIGSQSVAR